MDEEKAGKKAKRDHFGGKLKGFYFYIIIFVKLINGRPKRVFCWLSENDFLDREGIN